VLNTSNQIIEKLKKIIAVETDFKVRVHNKMVAEYLDMNYQTLATKITRKQIPFREIILFCGKRKICANEIFFNQRLGVVDAVC